MRLAKTTTLSALAGLGLVVTDAYSFDISRFFNDFPRQHPAARPFGNSGALLPSNDFLLSHPGKIEASSGAEVMNINVPFTNAKTSSAQPQPKTKTAKGMVEKMNTSYSYHAGSQALGAECGPSPMTPAEIENLVNSTAETYGVDPRFAKAITWIESRFDRTRNSPKGARGPMQLMPETALQLGVDDICDPVSNIDGGVRHLKALLDEFQNPFLAAAAYNAGSQAIYDHGGVPPYGETISYVASVINHELGLPAHPERTKAHAVAPNGSPSMSDEKTGGLLGSKGSRFVNGVMHF